MKFWLVLAIVGVSLIPVGDACGRAKQVATAVAAGTQRTDEGKIRFSFQNQDWSTVVPWFAEQAGLNLQHVERWPEGTFNLRDDQSYTNLQALDQLNRVLAGLTEPFTLIRNRKTLLLKPTDEPINDDLIELVDVADLNQRGAFEIIAVSFEMDELDASEMAAELLALVSERNQQYFVITPSANRIKVRETGLRLRNIRDTIAAAQKIIDDAKLQTITYQLKFQDAETFIGLVGGSFGIAEGQTANEDGTFRIIAEPLSDRLFVQGNNQTLDQFKQLAGLIDSDPNQQQEFQSLEKPTLKTYPVSVDPKLAFDLLDTMLAGRDVKMQQDEQTGSITIQGRTEDHLLAKESLESVSQSKSTNFEIVKLKKISASEALAVMQSVYRQNTLTDDVIRGPVLLANPSLNTVIVSGTAMEVADSIARLKKLDDTYELPETGPRTSVRIIPMTSDEQERLMPAISDLLGTVGRQNPFRVIRPQDRKTFKRRSGSGSRQQPTESETAPLPEDLNGLLPPSAANPDRGMKRTSAVINHRLSALACFMMGSYAGPAMTGGLWLQEDEPISASDKPTDNNKTIPRNSINGAPIEFRFTEYGLTIETDDLDAADDIESAIQDFLGERGTVQLPTKFELKHRPAAEMKQLLEENLGLSDPDSGSGGGGGLLGGLANNLVGGGNDLVDSLLGGDGSGSGGEVVLQGDVVFIVDARFNHLWVRGATDTDLGLINSMVDILDQPESQTKPEVAGRTRMIKVFYRDAAELVDIIKGQRPEIMFKEEPKGGRQNNNEIAKAMQAVQSLTGNKKKGGGSTDSDSMKPKVKLSADPVNNLLLVTGPQYLYDEIKQIVMDLDVEQPERYTEVVSDFPAFLLGTLRQRFPGKLQITDMETGEEMPGGSSTKQQPEAGAKADVNRNREAIQQQFRNIFRQQQNTTNRGAQRNRGGQRNGQAGQRGGGGR